MLKIFKLCSILMVEYKVVELSLVTDETIQQAVNTWTQQGWTFEGLHFAMGAGSKRPAMAFIFFIREKKGEL